jgi:hypothetical protein
MKDNRLPINALFGRTDGRIPQGRPAVTWTEYARGDLRFLSDLKCLGHTLTGGR